MTKKNDDLAREIDEHLLPALGRGWSQLQGLGRDVADAFMRLWTEKPEILTIIAFIPLLTFWLCKMVLWPPYTILTPGIALASFIAGLFLANRSLTKNRREFERLFKDLNIANNQKLHPLWLRAISNDDETITHVFLGRQVVAEDLEKQKVRIAAALKKTIVAIVDEVHDGSIHLTVAGKPLPEKIDIEALIPKGTVAKSEDPLILGKSSAGTVRRKLSSLPHLLIAGATGSGKSSLIRAVLYQLFQRRSTTEVIILDTKDLDFQACKSHSGIKYISDRMTAFVELNRLNQELESRQENLKKRGFRTIDKAIEKDPKSFYRILVIIDEFTDLTRDRTSGSGYSTETREALSQIERLSRLGRASGIHLILSTQLPDRTVVPTGLRVNFPAKLCFGVPNNADSIAVLGTGAAWKLPKIPGRAIFQEGSSQYIIQAPNLTDDELKAVLDATRSITIDRRPSTEAAELSDRARY